MHAISVVACTFNRARELRDFLERLEAHVLRSSIDAEIIIIDNNSTDSTSEIVAAFKSKSNLPVIIAHEAQQGTNYARNAAIRIARSPIIVFTDDDVDFSDTWLQDFYEYMQSHPECQVATGEIIPRFLATRPDWLAESMLGYYGQQQYGTLPVDIEFPDFPVEMNMAIRTTLFERYGGFSTAFNRDAKTLMSNDGKFFFYQLSENKEIVRYIPAARLYHLIPEARINPAWIIRRYFWQGVSDVAFQQLVDQPKRFLEKMGAVIELFKLLNHARGGYLSPRRMNWHYRSLSIASRAWYAYQLGTLSRKLGLR